QRFASTVEAPLAEQHGGLGTVPIVQDGVGIEVDRDARSPEPQAELEIVDRAEDVFTKSADLAPDAAADAEVAARGDREEAVVGAYPIERVGAASADQPGRVESRNL